MYDTDFFLWTQHQAEALRDHKISVLDWPNLAEEVEALGRSELRMVNSLIKQIIIHKIKLDYLADKDGRKHWLKEINNFRDQLEYTLTNSLKNKIDLQKLYEKAKRDILLDYELDLPNECIYPLEKILEDKKDD